MRLVKHALIHRVDAQIDHPIILVEARVIGVASKSGAYTEARHIQAIDIGSVGVGNIDASAVVPCGFVVHGPANHGSRACV